jgi:acetylornithine deacetylase
MLSGHTDVVPVDGQHWTADPFTMFDRDQRLYGRGTTDMKGFVASVLALAPKIVERELAYPLHFAFSYDEEIGCVGVRKMIDMLENVTELPGFCIIGEPTSLEVATAHKGKTGAVCRCYGVEAHSALASQGLNAIHLAAEMITEIRQIQDYIACHGHNDTGFSVPHSTLHVGTIKGGTALNIIPGYCEFKFEIRNLKYDDPVAIVERIKCCADEIVGRYRGRFPDARIDIEIFNQYPALDTPAEDEIVGFVKKLANTSEPIKIDFGTEGGLFQTRLNVPTVVCGPGSMEQGHKPDEYIEKSELERCDQFLNRLLDQISR